MDVNICFFTRNLYRDQFGFPLSTLLTIWERIFGQIWENMFFPFSFMSAIIRLNTELNPICQ